VATPCRHTFSGAVVACLVAATAWLGGVPAADAVSSATSAESVAPDACPPSWPALNGGLPAAFDGNVSVLVGGSLLVSGAASGAEGTVVTLGNAVFQRDVPGSYAVGVTPLGSQVTPYAGSDMLVVGGDLSGSPGTHLDVGQGLGGDVVVGGTVAPGTDIDPHGGRVDQTVANATAPFADLAGQLAGKSATYAGLPTTGSVEVTDDQLTMSGDGVSNPQVFTIDASTLVPGAAAGRDDRRDDSKNHDRAAGGDHGDNNGGSSGRSLQLIGVPDGAAVVVNLVGPEVDLDIDSIISATGTQIDPLSDPAFAGLTTHLLWNAPTAAVVNLTGESQLPGSLLVPAPAGTTTISNAGTNGRILVGGNLVHNGPGELHAYPLIGDQQLGCAPDPVHLTTLTLAIDVVDPDHVVEPDRFYEGTFACTLGGVSVTPPDNTWRMRASATPRTISDLIPSGATCTVKERLVGLPAPLRAWADPSVAPDVVVVAKRELRGFVITNKVKDQPAPPTPTGTPTTDTPSSTPTATPTETVEPPPSPVQPTTTAPPATPSSNPEPTNRPTQPPSSALPTPQPTSSASPSASSEAPHADAPNRGGSAGPMITTTAPFTLRGAFVWGPLLMLSLLTLLLRVRARPRRLH
jgi:Domain of unknown function (DUF5979)